MKIDHSDFSVDPHVLYCSYWDVPIDDWGIIEYKHTLRLPLSDGTEELFELTDLLDAGDLPNLFEYDL